MSHTRVKRGFIERALGHLPALRRRGQRLTRNAADAEDLVQDTLARALERSGELRDPERMRGWLISVQRTVHLNGRRGLRPKLEVLAGGLAAPADAPAEATPETALLDATLSDELAAALDALPREWREALWLREVEELSYEEIARAQGCPVGTVRSRLARARSAVHERLVREGERVDL
ncbi:RNA polymerase sigma factor [Anaeromyxobacter terrae]|uniref:RNA polymerase sigma factor n=1 Tax=Anaeromyxobacter terrae TaxID=2925406 RepID=UPI001F56E9D7|nr:sigma-70 family RNA polymerase sigma factor [Anaeromyxobacter sp. SG22]